MRRLIKKIKETGSTDRRPGSGRPTTICTEENMDLIEELVCLQEEPHSHLSPRMISEQTGFSRTSIR